MENHNCIQDLQAKIRRLEEEVERYKKIAEEAKAEESKA